MGGMVWQDRDCGDGACALNWNGVPDVSKLFSILSPFIALGLTLFFGGIMFLMLGKDPFAALYSFFIEPLTEVWSLHELAIKAAPLILIAVGLSVCYR